MNCTAFYFTCWNLSVLWVSKKSVIFISDVFKWFLI